jgi:hypothetical protein
MTAVFAATTLLGANGAWAQKLSPIPVPPLVRKIDTKIIMLSKLVKGAEYKVKDALYACHNDEKQQTRQFVYRVKGDISSWTCDEPCSNPALNGTFEAVIEVKRRENPGPNRGCLTGDWRITNAAGVPVASGKLVGTVWAGTHDNHQHTGMILPPDCESCAEPFHFEGYLEGRAQAPAMTINDVKVPACRGPICATFQGTGLDPNRITTQTSDQPLPTVTMRIEGAVTVPCKDPVYGPVYPKPTTGGHQH